MELYPHQQKAVDELGNGKILWGGVGTGKSLTAMAYHYTRVCKGVVGDYGSMRDPRDVYVITTAKKRDSGDWEEEAHHFGIHSDRLSSPGNVKLTVDSWNNIEKYKEVKDAFFIFDEQRLVGSGSWTKAFIKIAKSNQWILLSATPGDTWLDYIPVFVANGWYKNRTKFKQEHVVYNTFSKFPKVDRYIGTGKLVKYRNQILVHMPYNRHTVRHCKDVVVDYDRDLFDKVVHKRWHVYENRPIRDVAELFSVMRKVVNSDDSRVEAVTQLLEKHTRLIVFYNFDYELEILRTLNHPNQTNSTFIPAWEEIPNNLHLEKNVKASLVNSPTNSGSGLKSLLKETKAVPESQTSAECGTAQPEPCTTQTNATSSFAIAEWNGHKHDPVPTTDRWVYLVQYTAGSEGWNCITTDAMVFYSQTYSYKAHHQAHGRTDRLNTPFLDLYYYHLKSKSSIDLAVSKSLRSKKSFNEGGFNVKF